MQLSIGVGNSSKIDGYAAGLEATGTVKEQLGDDSPDFVFVFSTIGYEHQDILDANDLDLLTFQLESYNYENLTPIFAKSMN